MAGIYDHIRRGDNEPMIVGVAQWQCPTCDKIVQGAPPRRCTALQCSTSRMPLVTAWRRVHDGWRNEY